MSAKILSSHTFGGVWKRSKIMCGVFIQICHWEVVKNVKNADIQKNMFTKPLRYVIIFSYLLLLFF